MRRLLTTPFVKGILGALVGGGLLILAIHIYSDHKALHEVITFLNANAGKIVAIPAPVK